MDYNEQLYLVCLGNIRFVTWAADRDDAKRRAEPWMGTEQVNSFAVIPLSNPGDRVHIGITLAI